MISYTDVHCHLLYGMDDGPKRWEEMEALLEDLSANHIRRVVATPHVTPGVKPFDNEEYIRLLLQAREIGGRMSPPVEVYGGAEILYTASMMVCSMLQEGRVPTMNGTNIVLVEFSPDVAYHKLKQAVDELVDSGFEPLLAHIERYQCLVQWPPRLKKLKKNRKIFYQVNAAWFLHKQNLINRRFMRIMVKKHLIDAVGTDAHNRDTRPVCMNEAYPKIKKICGSCYAEKITNGSFLFGTPTNSGSFYGMKQCETR